MIKVKVVYVSGKESLYDVEFHKSYVRKIIESENDLPLEQKKVKEIYVDKKLVAKFEDGFVQELRSLVTTKFPKPVYDAYIDRQKPNAGMGKYKGHTVPNGDRVNLVEELGDVKDKIKADEDWNEYQAEILHAQKMLKENAWVINKYTMNHTGGNVNITYIPKSL